MRMQAETNDLLWTIVRSSKDVVRGWTILKSSIYVSMDDVQGTLHDSTLCTVDGQMSNTWEDLTY